MSEGRKRERSSTSFPKNIRDYRAYLLSKRARNSRDIKESSTQFDIKPDPTKEPAAITKSLLLAKQTSTQTGIALSSVLSTELVAPKFAKSIYVGGFDAADTNEKELFDFFNSTLSVTSNGVVENSVVSVYMNKSKCFAFIEFNDHNIATAVIDNLNGVHFKNAPLVFRRPTNYDSKRCPPVGKMPELDVSKVGLKLGRPSTFVENVPEKIYVAGIPPTVTDDQLQELLEAFGALEALCVVRERGYAFCLYKDKSLTDAACAGLNGLALGAQILTVKRADVNAKPVNTDINLGDVSEVEKMLPSGGGLEAYGMDGNKSSEEQKFLEVDIPAPPVGFLPPPPEPMKPTRILILKNMLNEEELRDDSEYEDIYKDIQQECSNYGTIVSLRIPRPTFSNNKDVGKVFVEFETELEALTAYQNLEARSFGDNKVECEFYKL